MARYTPTSVPTTENVGQLERWLREEVEQIRAATDDIYAVLEFSVDKFVAAGYGGIGQDAANNSLPNVPDNGWIDYTGFDIPLVSPRGVGYDFANDGIIFESVGVWYISLKVTLEHNESNGGRVIGMRFDNRATDTPGAITFSYGVGRNNGVSNLSLGVFFEVFEDDVGQAVGVEIGGIDGSFSSVNCIGAIFQAHHISEYKGELDIGRQAFGGKGRFG